VGSVAKNRLEARSVAKTGDLAATTVLARLQEFVDIRLLSP